MAKNVALSAYKAGEKARRKGKYHKPKMTISLAMVAGFAPVTIDSISMVRQYGIQEVPHAVAWHLLGINTWDNNQFNFARLLKGWTPILAGVLAHKAANSLGINRVLARMGIPLLRV